MLTVGSLFSGIGGFDLGLERAGMRTVWFCEQDPFCKRVLAKHWPGVPVHDDVCALVADADGAPKDTCAPTGGSRQTAGERGDVGPLPVPVPYVDVLCGGFPCQDLSYAGRGAGLDGNRSGLWGEYARLIRELRPRYVVVENVSALLARGLGRVLADLAACGYDAEWDCIPASAVGAPHRRDRIWLVAYPNGSGLGSEFSGLHPRQFDVERRCADVGDPDAERRDGRTGQLGQAGRREPADAGWWLSEPRVGGSAHGLPTGLDGRRLDADASQGGPGSFLRSVWLATGTQADQRALGGPERVPATPLLRPEVHGAGLCQRHGLLFGLAEEGYAVPWNELRVVWGYDESARPSHRRELAQRLCREHSDLVRELSRLAPPPCPACWQDGSWEAGLSRVAAGVPARVDRLRSLGNALVPQIAQWLGERIVAYEEAISPAGRSTGTGT
jgi:DNA (cytosine-5)-methyltransferase 1